MTGIATSAITIDPVRDLADVVFHLRPGTRRCPIVLEVYLEDRSIGITYRPDTSGVPERVASGFVRWFEIPLMTRDAMNDLLAQVAPFAQAMADDWERVWEGGFRAVLGQDGETASLEIHALTGRGQVIEVDGERLWIDQPGADDDDPRVLDMTEDTGIDLTAEDWGVTAHTTDAELAEIVREFIGVMTGDGFAEVVGAAQAFDELRDQVRLEADDEEE